MGGGHDAAEVAISKYAEKLAIIINDNSTTCLGLRHSHKGIHHRRIRFNESESIASTHNICHLKDKRPADCARRVIHSVAGDIELHGVEHNHRERIAHGHCRRSRVRRGHTKWAGLFSAWYFYMDIAHAGEGGVRLAGKRNHLKTMAPDGRDKTQNFVRLSREAKREKYIARRDHAEVAMHGLNRIKHDRARTGGSENRAHLFGDGEVLAYAGHDDNTLRRNAIEHKRDRLGETFAEGFAGAAQPFNFYIEDFAGSS